MTFLERRAGCAFAFKKNPEIAEVGFEQVFLRNIHMFPRGKVEYEVLEPSLDEITKMYKKVKKVWGSVFIANDQLTLIQVKLARHVTNVKYNVLKFCFTII